MRSRNYILSVLLLCTSLLAVADSIFAEGSPELLFDASAPAKQQKLNLINREQCSSESTASGNVLCIQPAKDAYNPETFEFRFLTFDDVSGPDIVLEIEFVDKGAGVIQPMLLSDDSFNGVWDRFRDSASFTRLNTGKVRSAFFRIEKPKYDPAKTKHNHLQIIGLQYLKSIKLHQKFDKDDWEAARASIPKDVTPLLVLNRPMQIVCSAGVDTDGSLEELWTSLPALRDYAPLAKVLGFTAVESYVRWDIVEPEKEGEFDWSFYDAVIDVLKIYDLKWFPLLIVGSAYSLPDWFADSDENVGFVCLEHGLSNPIQSIWSPHHPRHVTRFLQAFGNHYEPMHILEGVRLGPSGNYGESQYPAGGNWGYKGEAMHIHIGYWAGDAYAQKDYQNFLRERYQTVANLNKAWETEYADFGEVEVRLPYTNYNLRRTLDMTEWYTKSMTDWCEFWTLESKKAMPNTKIYQSAGGWGFREAGTDYSAQTKTMVSVDGGIRLTNETDSFHQNYYATRLAATAARLYGVDLGFEPASSHTARGTTGRIYNTTVTNGDHFFTYHANIMNRPYAIDRWMENFKYFDMRHDPVIDVAVYYPETMNQLDPGTFRYLYGWGFNPRAREIREQVEIDYLDERLIRDGFLDRYKVLVFAWGDRIEADVQEVIDKWLRNGGTIIYPSFPKGGLSTPEGNSKTFHNWSRGDCGQGKFHRFRGDMEPPALYGEYVRELLFQNPDLNPLTRLSLQIKHPPRVYFSVQEDGHVLAINYSDEPAKVVLKNRFDEVIKPYTIARLPLLQ